MEFLRSLGLRPKLGLSYGYWRFSGISRTYVASKTISGKLIPLWKLLDCLYSFIPFYPQIFGLFRVLTPEYPMQDALGMGDILHLKSDFVAGPQRHLKPRKDTCLWTQWPLNQLCQKLDQCIFMLTSADRLDVVTHIPATRHGVLPDVHFGTLESIFLRMSLRYS